MTPKLVVANRSPRSETELQPELYSDSWPPYTVPQCQEFSLETLSAKTAVASGELIAKRGRLIVIACAIVLALVVLHYG